MSVKAQQCGRTCSRSLAWCRFFDSEVVGFADGGALQWRVGDVGNKPNGCPPGTPGCKANFVFPVAVRAYAWLYTWPLQVNPL